MAIYFNNCIEKYCKRYGVNTLNLWPHIMKDDYNVDEKYINTISKNSIHLLYEPLILTLFEKGILQKFGIKRSDLKMNIETTLNNYVKQVDKKYKLIAITSNNKN